MNFFKIGDSQKAACEKCKGFENAIFKLRNVPLSDGSGIIKDVLVGVCDKCNSVSILPQQSTPLVKRQLDILRKYGM